MAARSITADATAAMLDCVVAVRGRALGYTGSSYIEPSAPWENPYVESFNGRLRDEFLVEQFNSLLEAQVLWRTGGSSTTRSARTDVMRAGPLLTDGYSSPRGTRPRWAR
ncbi:MAG: integrase core domain-containing protein [Chloroflexi bacterium]|nr:integrase core domain-containing protein [Chloroflexota bacterium]